MIAAVQKDKDLLRDIASRRPDPEKFDIWWLGHGGFLLAWNGKHLLFDPYLSDSFSDRGSRTTELVVDPAKLVMIDVVTAGNVRGDHLDSATLSALREVNPAMRLVLPWAGFDSASAAFAGGSAPELIGLDEGSTAQVGDFRFHGISAALGQVRRDGEGRCDSLGFVVEFGRFTIFHIGDTGWHSSLLKQLEEFQIDLALVPMSEGGMNGTESAALARAIGVRMAVPHHFQMFEAEKGVPEEFASVCERLGQPCRVLRAGERLTAGDSDSV